MLDIKLFRENPDAIRKSEKARFKDEKAVDLVVKHDNEWRECLQKANSLREKRNAVTKEIAKLKAEKKSAEKKISEMKKINDEIKRLEARANECIEKRDEARYKIGVIIHESVPIGKTEESNRTERVFGKRPEFRFEPRPHTDLVEMVDGANVEKAADVSAARFYYLKNDLVFLNVALMKFGLEFLAERGYKPMWTPFFLNRKAMSGAAELGDFAQQLYKIEGEDLFMIATSEQTIAAYHQDEIIEEEGLPLKYAGISSCFRREAGAHGKDTKGIFRVHQFEKIEQYIFCRPEDSWKMHDEIIGNAEAIFKKLGIHHRVVNIASGELNDSAARKYDLEAWFPAQNTFREVVSASNCLDYQARKLNVRFGKAGASKDVVHTLNATAIATERTICAILENYQQPDGTVLVPDVLKPYMNGKEVIGKKH